VLITTLDKGQPFPIVRRLVLCASLITFWTLSKVQAGQSPRPAQDTMNGNECSDSIKDCKKPVKFVSKKDGCYTFACEVNSSKEHNIHTKDQSQIRELLQMEKEGGKDDGSVMK